MGFNEMNPPGKFSSTFINTFKSIDLFLCWSVYKRFWVQIDNFGTDTRSNNLVICYRVPKVATVCINVSFDALNFVYWFGLVFAKKNKK